MQNNCQEMQYNCQEMQNNCQEMQKIEVRDVPCAQDPCVMSSVVLNTDVMSAYAAVRRPRYSAAAHRTKGLPTWSVNYVNDVESVRAGTTRMHVEPTCNVVS
jgi:hypothetical protein